MSCVSGPPAGPFELPAERASIIGRSVDANCCLPDLSVSRKHAEISRRAGRWFVKDLDSKSGTYLNMLKLTPNLAVPMVSGDTLRINPWMFRVQIGAAEAHAPSTLSMRTLDDAVSGEGQVETLGAEAGGTAQQRLELLLEYASELNTAGNEEDLAQSVVRRALTGSGLARAALLRPVDGGESVEVIASATADGTPASTLGISRSLVREAWSGRTARLNARATPDVAQSIISMGIHSAVCAPVIVDGAVELCLYLDARGNESRVRSDASDFCLGIAKFAGMALENIKRRQLESRSREMETELAAARQAQQVLVPKSGSLAGVHYRVHMRPGAFVAGDLFDVVPLDGRSGPGSRLAVCIGDVTGHGAGAGILMAAAQAHLNAALRHRSDPALAVADTGRYIAEHAAEGHFVSLWVGVFDSAERTVTVVDAGHGHWLMLDANRKATRIRSAGGLLLGVEADAMYESQVIPIDAGARIVLYSDGIVEQSSPGGDMFGLERLQSVLVDAASDNPEAIIAAVTAHARTDSLDDDATAAIVQLA